MNIMNAKNSRRAQRKHATGGKKRPPKYDLSWLAETFRILKPLERDMEHVSVSCHQPPDHDAGGVSDGV